MFIPFVMLVALWKTCEAEECTEWHNSSYGCHKLCLIPQTFNNAEHQCKNLGGNLVSIHSGKEDSYVFDFVRKFGATALKYGSRMVSPPVWLGLVEKKNYSWEWTDSTKLDYMRCAECSNLAEEAQLSNRSAAFCAYMETYRPQYRRSWFAKPCTEREPYVCKKKDC
ncbi:hypothetical protein GCK32_011526 [Trichostrongylus colubriformis]|uniref:C-type lectin domain-containing protein n=1 Tax=Trichostrongylus colubriformis TaxID=6319 RepID=A0AAN8G6R2_TRICO